MKFTNVSVIVALLFLGACVAVRTKTEMTHIVHAVLKLDPLGGADRVALESIELEDGSKLSAGEIAAIGKLTGAQRIGVDRIMEILERFAVEEAEKEQKDREDLEKDLKEKKDKKLASITEKGATITILKDMKFEDLKSVMTKGEYLKLQGLNETDELDSIIETDAEKANREIAGIELIKDALAEATNQAETATKIRGLMDQLILSEAEVASLCALFAGRKNDGLDARIKDIIYPTPVTKSSMFTMKKFCWVVGGLSFISVIAYATYHFTQEEAEDEVDL